MGIVDFEYLISCSKVSSNKVLLRTKIHLTSRHTYGVVANQIYKLVDWDKFKIFFENVTGIKEMVIVQNNPDD